MSIVRLTAAIMALAIGGSAPASADYPSDVEFARGNARAGGPISAYDAELLRRWGCLSGTRSPFCERRFDRRRYYRERRRERR